MIRTPLRWLGAAVMACNLALAGPGTLLADGPHRHDSQENGDPNDFLTQTPIKHLVVIFQENVSFDHYLATYPNAPTVNGLTPSLLTHNPNSKQPFRPDRSQNLTCDMNHDYTPELRRVVRP